MRTLVNSETGLDKTSGALNLVVLYEGLQSGFGAKEAYDQICVRLPKGAGTRLSLWRFDSVTEGRTKRAAHRDVTEADVVLVAADGGSPLPPELERTLEQWLSEGAARIGLGALLHGVPEDEKEDSPVHAFLERLARNYSLDFFSQATGSSFDSDSFLITGAVPQLSSDLLEPAVPCRGFGLCD